MAKRIVVGTGLILFLFLMLWLHGLYIQLAVIAVAIVAEYEMIRTIRASGTRPVAWVLYAFPALIFVMYQWARIVGMVVLVMGAVCAILLAGVFSEKYNYESIKTSMFAICYPQMFFVFFYLIVAHQNIEMSREMILVSFAASSLTDICAYFTGMLFGKHKLAPKISPKKTVEGAIGGLIGGMIGIVLVGLAYGRAGMTIVYYAIFGLLVSILSQGGDLVASYIKRHYGVKDFGDLLPGHGGVMDRFDSVVFIMPLIYMLFKLYYRF